MVFGGEVLADLLQVGAGDILADAKAINDQRAVAAEAEVVEDAFVESEPAAETAE